ncbi:hypothetical protein D3C80_1808390 [compost metagenome]
MQGVLTRGGIHLQRRAVVCLGQRLDLVAPAQLDHRVGVAGIDQKLLQARLLQVGHGRKTVIGVVRGLHAKYPLIAVVGIAKAPGQAR